jgi:hypothetical protein
MVTEQLLDRALQAVCEEAGKLMQSVRSNPDSQRSISDDLAKVTDQLIKLKVELRNQETKPGTAQGI